MAATTTETCMSLIGRIRKGEYAPVYIFAGEEAFYLDALADALQENVLPEEERDFNQHIFYGPELQDLDTAIGVARQFPVMSDRKLVMVKEAQGMFNAKKQLEKMSKYCVAPVATTIFVLIFKGKELTASQKWVKEAVAKGAVYFNSPQVASWNLDREVRAYCSMNKINIEAKALSMLNDSIGSNMARYFNELDKLRLSVDKKDGAALTVTAEMVERNIGRSKEYNNYELSSAVMLRDYGRAMAIVDRFGKDPKSNPLTVTCVTLFNIFTRLLIMHYSPVKTEESVKATFNLKSISAVREIMAGIHNYSASSCVNAIRTLRDFDRKIKGVGTAQKDTELVKELIYYLFTR